MMTLKYRTAWGCGALMVVLSGAQSLCRVPLLRIIELNICRTYYSSRNPSVIGPDGQVEEQLCKILSIQEDVATINAYNIAISAFIELLTAFPYASICRYFNRRSILMANVTGTFTALAHTMCICYFYQTFDIRLIWGQSLWRLFGGGDSVISSITSGLIAESLPAANLSKIIFTLNAMRLLANASCQMIGARLMQEMLWAPILMGIAAHVLTIPALCLITDRGYRKSKELEAVGIDIASDNTISPLISKTKQRNDETILYQTWKSITTALQMVPALCRDPTTALTLVVFFVNEFGHGVNNIVQQWSSRTFSWTLAHTNYFLAGQRIMAGVTMMGLSVVVHGLQKTGIASARLDLGLVAFCQWITLLGMLGVGLSWMGGSESARAVVFVGSLLVHTMGWGMSGALQSMVTAAIPTESITVLYTGLNVMDRMAAVASGPVFAALLTEGMQQGGRWEYLPYWMSAGVFVLVSVLTKRLMRRLMER